MRKNICIAREIDEGKDIVQVAKEHNVKPVDSDFQPISEQWWLEKLFERAHLSFTKGVLLVYALSVLPEIFFIPAILQLSPREFQIGYFATYFGALTVLVILIPLNIVNRGLRKLVKQLNESMSKRFVAPTSLIGKKHLNSNKDFETLDKDYQNLYVKPIVFKTLRFGVSMSYNKYYQIGAGFVGAGIFSTLFLLGRINFWIPIENPIIATGWLIYSFFECAFLWFLVAMLAWSLFLVFMSVLQTSAQIIEIRPFERLRELFHPVTSLVLKTSFALTAIVAWASPYLLIWGVLPQDILLRQNAINFVEVVLAVLVPVIALSLIIPFLVIHKGMEGSRQRALLIKRHKLDELKKNPMPNFDRNLRVQTHLIEDYKMITENAEWMLSATQVLEVVGTILLPIITFLLSRLP